MITMIVTIAWELTSDFTGCLNVPEWLDNTYDAIWNFWKKVF